MADSVTMVDPVGTSETAEILGWKKQRVSLMVSRGKFPQPMIRLAAGPLWEKRQIEEYIKLRGGLI